MNYIDLAKTFWDQGYLLLEDFFSVELSEKYHQLILDHFGYNPEFCHNEEFLKKSATEVIPWFPQHEGVNAFDEGENDPRLFLLTEAILGEGWRSLYCMSMYSKPNSKGQAWHQDCPPEDTSQFNMNRLMYTHHITDIIGGQVLVVPGSHRRGAITAGKVDEDLHDQLVIFPQQGTLLLIHGHTWHRVLPVKDHYRVSTNYRCMPKGVPENVTDVCVYRNMRYRFETNSVVEDRTVI
ncbi:MAG: phytanoyl-CoA dioxygenase family protein [Pseudomonadales bacterium]